VSVLQQERRGSIRIDDQRSRHRAKSDQMIPIEVIPREPRSFQSKHGADGAAAHRGQQFEKARPLDQAAPALAPVVVDDDRFGEAQLLGAVGQFVLPLSSGFMVRDLMKCTHVYI